MNLLPPEAKRLFAESPRGWTPAEWALRWLWDQPAVTCVLSGMNDLEMIEENCHIADEVQPGALTKEDFALLERVKTAIQQRVKAPCTGCGYCMPCPKGVDIPRRVPLLQRDVYRAQAHRPAGVLAGCRPAQGTGFCDPVRRLRQMRKPTARSICRSAPCSKKPTAPLRPPHYRVAGWVARKFLFGRKG